MHFGYCHIHVTWLQRHKNNKTHITLKFCGVKNTGSVYCTNDSFGASPWGRSTEGLAVVLMNLQSPCLQPVVPESKNLVVVLFFGIKGSLILELGP